MRINELEVGKIYKSRNRSYRYKIVQAGNINRLMCKCGYNGNWKISGLSYDCVVGMNFTEIKQGIDWTKVPKFTKARFRDFESDEWINLYFLGCCVGDDYPFIASKANTTDEFTGFTPEDIKSIWLMCELHPSVEVQPEWLKEE